MSERVPISAWILATGRRRFFGVVALAIVLFSTPVEAQLQNGGSFDGRIEPGKWAYFFVDVRDWHSSLDVELNSPNLFSLMPDARPLYIRRSQSPTLSAFDWNPVAASPGVSRQRLNEASSPALASIRYFIGVYNPTKRTARYRVTATLRRVASQRQGMGATPFSGGTMFRVWAPFADSVHVAGDFNGWNSTAAQMVSEGNGHWSLDLRNANPGQRYQYVVRRGNQTIWNVDPREEQVVNSIGDSVIFDNAFTWTDQGFTMPDWNSLVCYEMHIGTFNDQPGGGPGTFDSAIARLDYLQDLGVNCIKLMPVHEFPGDFSWGYNPSYPFTVESSYGGPLALKRFVNESHRRGIAVLMDLVHNHYGPYDMDLWRFDGWFQNDRGGIYFYQDERADTPWGNTRPDFGRGEVRQYIRDNALMWLQEFKVDGFRWDSTVNVRRTVQGDNPDGWSLLQWVNDEIDRTQPWKISIAEDLQGNAWLTRDTGAGGAGFDSQWHPDFVHPLRTVMTVSSDNDRSMASVRSALTSQYSGDAMERVIYTESHDEVANGRSRVAEEIWPGNAGSWFSRKRSTMGAALVMTGAGVPMIFQGQELLEDGYFQDTDPMDWNKLNTFSGIHRMYRDLIRLRRNWFNHTRGLRGHNTNVFHVNENDKMIAFHRWDQGGAGDDVIVICNFRGNQSWQDYRIGLPRGGVWKVRFNSDWNGYSADFGNFWSPDVTAQAVAWDGLQWSGLVRIAPYSVLILSQDP